jgi:hypothetical protein
MLPAEVDDTIPRKDAAIWISFFERFLVKPLMLFVPRPDLLLGHFFLLSSSPRQTTQTISMARLEKVTLERIRWMSESGVTAIRPATGQIS